MRYVKDVNHGYLGESKDMTNKVVHGFLIDNTIHVVYNLFSEDEYSATKELEVIQQDLDKYLWTPFAEFAALSKKN